MSNLLDSLRPGLSNQTDEQKNQAHEMIRNKLKS